MTNTSDHSQHDQHHKGQHQTGQHQTDQRQARPVRYYDVRDSPYALAASWGDRSRWPRLGRDVAADLHELAVMSRLSGWLSRLAAYLLHDALRHGATPTQVAEAAGVDQGEITRRWLTWAYRQRRLRRSYGPGSGLGMPDDEFEQVCTLLATDTSTEPPLVE